MTLLRGVLCIALATISSFAATSVLAQTYTFTHFAGSPGGAGYEDGTGSAARFQGPRGVAVDSSGNLYVADTDNYTIRKISPAGVVTTLAGLAEHYGNQDGKGSAARFGGPGGIAVDASGNVYFSDYYTIRKLTPTGFVTTLAGTDGTSGSSDGAGAAASFYYALALAADNAGNIYVADEFNSTIRKVTPSGIVSTFAGLAGSTGSADGTSDARFFYPVSIATDSTGNVYVGDSGNYTIRKITPAGVVSTLAGLAGSYGYADGTGSQARFYNVDGLGVDSSGNVYVANGTFVRKITPGGTVSTLAGNASSGWNDGTGTGAAFNYPLGLASDASGNVFLAESFSDTIRKVTPGGVVTTLAGSPETVGGSDGTGGAATFAGPDGIAVAPAGDVYVTDGSIRKITSAGVVSLLAGGNQSGADGTGAAAGFLFPSGLCTDGTGNVYVADTGHHTIREVTSSGVVTTIAGLADNAGNTDGTGSSARFNTPTDVAVDSGGNLYVTDRLNYTIRRITPAGLVSTLAGLAGSSGASDGTGSLARFTNLLGIVSDSSDNIYVADGTTIRQLTTAGVVTTLAGQQGVQGDADGPGTDARFVFPEGLAADAAGNVYTADTIGNIRRITPAGIVTTLGGCFFCSGTSDGTGVQARFIQPKGVGFDRTSGYIYITDYSGCNVRIGRPAIADTATIDSSVGPVGSPRQLNTSPQTATSWQWSIIRRPAGSTANLSSTSIRNPTFTPDVGDLYQFRLVATNSSGSSITNISLQASTPPVITAAAPLSRTAGSPGSNTTIATVSDAEDLAGDLSVFTSAPVGIIVTDVVNNNGIVTATVTADCTAATGANIISLQVHDSADLITTANLTVNVAPDPAPTLGTYSNATINQGQSTTVTPSVAPSDNGEWSLSAVASAGFAGGVSADPGTGQVFIVNPNAGNYTITVTAMDNCNVTTSESFALTVTAPVISDRVQNGGFEENGGLYSPALTDWTVVTSGSGSWYAQSGTASPPPGSGFTVAAPPGGSFAAMTSEGAPGMMILYQDVAIPAQTAPPTLSFRLYLNNQYGFWASPASPTLDPNSPEPNQQFRMDVIDPGGAVDTVSVSTGLLLNVYETHPGDPLISPAGYDTVTASIPTNLTGRTIRLRFAVTDNQFFLFAGIDDVQIDLRPVITGGPAVSRTAGITDNSSVTIAFVSDREDAAGSLNVTPASAPTGISIGNIANNAGTVTAAVNASCSATVGMNAVTLQVVDSVGNTATASLSVNVVASTPPTLGNYGNVSTGTPGTLNVTPTAAPSGSGTVNLTVAASPAFTSGSSLSVSSSTGVVSIGSAKSGTYTITVTATGNCSSTVAKSFTLTVIPPFGAPANLVATASPTSSTTVQVSWNAVADATGYQVQRRLQAGASCPSPSCIVLLVGTNPYIDTPVAANTAYLYTVSAIQFMNGVILKTSPESNADLATTVIFTDNTLIAGSTPIKAAHVTELRTAVNAVRALTGAGAYSFTDPTLSNQAVKAVHVTELRTVLNTARSSLGLPLITYTNALTAQSSVIKALDWTEIRNGVK